jgi:serine-type D-Ala-D-Ala carboxypeptidase/endopeptidase (penicillin-binding protein 4)
MQRIRRSIILYVLLFAVCAAAADKPKELQKRVDEILSQPDVARGFWGIEVVSLDSGKTLFSDNADKLFTPASNTKLFTTAAALALIGPEYKFLTTVETKGTVDKYGRLNGDLVLVGRGDPNLSGRTLPYSLRTERNLTPVHVLESLADQIAAKGVKVIDGDVVGDDTYFAFQRYGEGCMAKAGRRTILSMNGAHRFPR